MSGPTGGVRMRKRSRLWTVAVVVLILAAAVWLGGDWLWHALLRMHGIEGH